MEEEIINYVRANPILFDPGNREYRNQHSRKEAWEEIGEKLGKSGDACKDMWNKLRNAYMQAKNRRATKSGQAGKKLAKWKFEDEMSFLNPTLEPRNSQGNTVPTTSDVGVDTPQDTDHLEETESRSIEGMDPPLVSDKGMDLTLPGNSHHSSQPVNIRLDMNPSVGLPSSHDPPFEPPAVIPDKRRAGVGKRRLDSSFQEMVSIMKANQRLCAELIRRNTAAPTPTVDHPINDLDECELLFLSLARSVKKLPFREQTRVKIEVSNIVLQAELQARCEYSSSVLNTQPLEREPQQLHSLNTPLTSQFSQNHQADRNFEESSSSSTATYLYDY